MSSLQGFASSIESAEEPKFGMASSSAAMSHRILTFTPHEWGK